MGDSAYKPKISGTQQDPVLKQAEIAYMKLIEERNRERVQKLQVISKRNRLTGFTIGAGVLGVYLYSIFAIKQETFLDDFDEPPENTAVIMAVAKTALQIRLPPLPSIKDVIKLYKLRALRELSQNFLMEPRLIDKIVRASGNIQNHTVCEVGPGPGGITRSIIRQAPKKLVLIEKDPRFLPSLELLADACRDKVNVDIITGDILKTDLSQFIPSDAKVHWLDPPPPVHLIGNLPFSVSTILIIRWLEMISKHEGPWLFGRTRMTLTFQKEVAERMAARILDKQRCRLSVMCQSWCTVKYNFDIPGTAFLPKPDVDVGVVTLTPLKHPIIKLPFKLAEKVVRQIFSMRQKYSIRGAQTLFPEEVREEVALKMYNIADIDPVTRPFQITNMEFARLCEAYNDIIKQHPEFEHYDYRAPKNKNNLINAEEVNIECNM